MSYLNFLDVEKIEPLIPKYMSINFPIINQKNTQIPSWNSGFKNENSKSMLFQIGRNSINPIKVQDMQIVMRKYKYAWIPAEFVYSLIIDSR